MKITRSEVTEEECRANAVAYMDKLITFREGGSVWDIASEISHWMYLIGLDLNSDDDYVFMPLESLKSLRDRVANKEAE